MASETELAYVAGLLDGEGTIAIAKQKPNSGSKSIKYILKIHITNTHLGVLLQCQKQFGGYICSKTHYYYRRKACYEWVLLVSKAKEFLKAILPYLVIKKEQAELGLSFLETRTACFDRRRGLSKEELNLRESYYLRMKQINQRGGN